MRDERIKVLEGKVGERVAEVRELQQTFESTDPTRQATRQRLRSQIGEAGRQADAFKRELGVTRSLPRDVTEQSRQRRVGQVEAGVSAGFSSAGRLREGVTTQDIGATNIAGTTRRARGTSPFVTDTLPISRPGFATIRDESGQFFNVKTQSDFQDKPSGKSTPTLGDLYQQRVVTPHRESEFAELFFTAESQFKAGQIPQGVIVTGMSTPTGQSISFLPTQESIRRIESGTPSRGEFLKTLPASESFYAAGSSVVIGFQTIVQDLTGLGTGLITAGFASPGTIGSEFSRGSKAGTSFVQNLEIPLTGGVTVGTTRQSDLFGNIIATGFTFGVGTANLIRSGVRGVGTVVRVASREKSIIAGFKSVLPSSERVLQSSVSFSPLKPATSMTSIEGAKSFTFGLERELKAGKISRDSTTLFFPSESKRASFLKDFGSKDIIDKKKFIDSQFFPRADTKQMLFPTQEGGFLGTSVTQTVRPKFLSRGVEDIFGGTKIELSLAKQDIPKGFFQAETPSFKQGAITGKSIIPQTQEALSIQTRIASMTRDSSGGLKVDIAKRFDPKFSRELGSSRVYKTGETFEATVDIGYAQSGKIKYFDDFIGVGGKPIGEFDVFKADDIFMGRRIRKKPGAVDEFIPAVDVFVLDSGGSVKIIKAAKIKKTPLSSTFQETVQVTEMAPVKLLPPTPKPSTQILKGAGTTQSRGASNVFGGLGIRAVDQSSGFASLDFASGFSAGGFEKIASASSASSGLSFQPTPRTDFGQSSIQPPRVSFAPPLVSGRQKQPPIILPIPRQRPATGIRSDERQLDFVTPIPKQIIDQLPISPQKEAFTDVFQQLTSQSFRPATTRRPFLFLPGIPPFGFDVKRRSKTKGRKFKRTPSFGAVKMFEFTGFGGGEVSSGLELTGLFEKGFGTKLPKIKLGRLF